MGANLKDKVAIVTGASRGLGREYAKALAAAGAQVIAADIKDCAETVEEITNAEHSAIGIELDVRDQESCRNMANTAVSRFGKIDILVNNAGITRDGMFHKMSQEQWRDVINVNLNGLFNMTHPVWDGMRTREFGRIVNISSINGQKGQLGQANYSAAKAGELGFTKSLALEGARKGITVNAICPGYINTDMVKAMSQKAIEATESQIPVGHLGEPDDIARCVKFLVADESSFITGSTISANGGHYLI